MPHTVFVTGASSGLGLSHAIYLTHRGYSVIGTSRNARNLNFDNLANLYLRDHTQFKFTNKEKTELKAVKSFVPKDIQSNLSLYLEKIKFISMDITNQISIKNALETIDQREVDVLINNAGIGYFCPTEEIDEQQYNHTFDLNFFGQVRLIHAFLPYMREKKQGRIINTSSLGGVISIPFQSMYSASKAAILRLTESLYTELKPFNIKVSVLCPGDINTAFDANTVKLHHTNITVNSDDIRVMKKSIPVKAKSPYYTSAGIAWNIIIENLILSPPPIIVSKKIEKIIRAKNPKIHYKVGSKFQTIGLTFAKRLLSETLATKIVSKIYGY